MNIRQFATGATRNVDTDKPDYEGFLSPFVIRRYGEYMHKHRRQADGNLRDSDNWQKGIPLAAYMKSGHRHFFDWWSEHRNLPTEEGIEEALCALIFNASGYLHEYLKQSKARNLCDETMATALAQDANDWHVVGTDADFSIVQDIPAESAYLASFGPNADAKDVYHCYPPLTPFIGYWHDALSRGHPHIGDAHPLRHVTLADRTPEDRL